MTKRKNLIKEMFKGRKLISKLTKNGAEQCDPVPLQVPTGLRKPPTMKQRMQRLMQQHQQDMQDPDLRQESDFDIDEPDPQPPAQYQGAILDLIETQPALSASTSTSPQKAQGEVEAPSPTPETSEKPEE